MSKPKPKFYYSKVQFTLPPGWPYPPRRLDWPPAQTDADNMEKIENIHKDWAIMLAESGKPAFLKHKGCKSSGKQKFHDLPTMNSNYMYIGRIRHKAGESYRYDKIEKCQFCGNKVPDMVVFVLNALRVNSE